jgi:hypothetical protein
MAAEKDTTPGCLQPLFSMITSKVKGTKKSSPKDDCVAKNIAELKVVFQVLSGHYANLPNRSMIARKMMRFTGALGFLATWLLQTPKYALSSNGRKHPRHNTLP